MSAPERSWRTLVSALVWRTRREGLRYLLPPVLILVFIAAVQLLAGLAGGRRSVNGADSLGAYAHRFGVTTNAAQVGATLATAPGELAVVLAVGGAIVVRNLIGSEASRGALEAILASRYRPRTLVTAVLAFAGLVTVGLWVITSLVAGVWLAVTVAVYDAHLSLGASYLGLLLVTPLLAALSGTALALALSMLVPRMAQQGQLGLSGGGGLGGVVAVVPSLILSLLVLAFHSIPIADLLVGTLVSTAVLLVGSVVLVSTRFRVEGLLEN